LTVRQMPLLYCVLRIFFRVLLILVSACVLINVSEHSEASVLSSLSCLILDPPLELSCPVVDFKVAVFFNTTTLVDNSKIVQDKAILTMAG